MALLKKRSKRGQSRLDFGADSVYESQHGLSVQDGPRLLDLDMEGKIALKAHIAFRVTPNGQRHLDRNRAAWGDAFSGRRVDVLNLPCCRIDERLAELAGRRHLLSQANKRCVEHLMLVDIREPVEMPKRVRFRRVSSLIWLEASQSAAAHSSQAYVPPGSFPLRRYLRREA